MRATGGSGSYAWSANGLPPGLHIDPPTGLIGGNASAIGTYTITVTTDSGVGSSNFTNFSWTVMGEPCTAASPARYELSPVDEPGFPGGHSVMVIPQAAATPSACCLNPPALPGTPATITTAASIDRGGLYRGIG